MRTKKSILYWLASGLLLVASAFPVRAENGLVKVEIKGLSGAEKANVEAAISLPPGIDRSDQVEKYWLKRYVRKIPQQVDEALQPFGFYHAQSNVDISTDDAGHSHIVVTVEPGPPVIVRTLGIGLEGEGADEKELIQVARAFPLWRGNSLSHERYKEGKLDLRIMAGELGYLKVKYTTSVIRVHPEENMADIELVLDTGPRFYFGDIRFVDASNTFEDSFLERYLTFQAGEVFSHRKLHRSRLLLYGANRFDEVQMVPQIDESVEQKVPVDVKLTPGPMQRLRPGVGYATDTGPRVSLSYQHMNVFDRTHSLTSDASWAKKQQSFITSYTIPRPTTFNDNLVGSVGYIREDIDSYENELAYTEIERVYGLGQGKYGSVYLRYQYEDYEIGVDKGIAHMTMPGLRYNQRSYDDPLNPTRGYQFRLELRGVDDALLSDLTIGQVLAGGNIMFPLSPDFTLHLRGEAATSYRPDELDKVPASLRFFVGGDNSVRGYSYKSRGPEDENGDVIGGDSLLVGSIECEYALSDNWGLAVFYDIGSAFNKLVNDIDFIEGAGVGIRRYTPIGPVKLDFATRLSEKPRGIHLHVSVGFDI